MSRQPLAAALTHYHLTSRSTKTMGGATKSTTTRRNRPETSGKRTLAAKPPSNKTEHEILAEAEKIGHKVESPLSSPLSRRWSTPPPPADAGATPTRPESTCARLGIKIYEMREKELVIEAVAACGPCRQRQVDENAAH